MCFFLLFFAFALAAASLLLVPPFAYRNGIEEKGCIEVAGNETVVRMGSLRSPEVHIAELDMTLMCRGADDCQQCSRLQLKVGEHRQVIDTRCGSYIILARFRSPKHV